MASRINLFSATSSAGSGMKAHCTGFNGHKLDARRARILENKRTRTEETVICRNLSCVDCYFLNGDGVQLTPLRVSDGVHKPRIWRTRSRKQPYPERFLLLRHRRCGGQRVVT